MREVKFDESGEILSGKRVVISGIGDFGRKIEDLWEECKGKVVREGGCQGLERESVEEK